ncbi:MAG: hypothetical protein ABEH59_12345 [Halobacteriales archaeon]
MRLLRTTPGLLAVAIAALAVVATAAQTAAHPPAEPDHGVNASTYHTFWAGDADAGNLTGRLNASNGSAAELEKLAAATDIPLDAPPQAVERWNRGELTEFPETDANRSIHPPDANLTDGRFVKDAYAAVFAVQPATRAKLSPGRQPHYVAPEGRLLGTVDYRVAVPADERAGTRSVEWRVLDHAIVKTRLLVDGTVVATANGSHTPSLAYALDSRGGQRHALTLEADIAVRLEKLTTVCTENNATTGNCTDNRTTVRERVETVTVSETLPVTTYDLTVSGHRARYPDGDLGLLVQKNQPWLGYTLPGGDVRGVWRFYAARDPDWDTLVANTANGSTTRHSPLHPLHVTAYPIETGPTPTPRGKVRILAVQGFQLQPPTLPPQVHLDVLERSYTASYGLTTRTELGIDARFDGATAYGLVRGVNDEIERDDLSRVPIHETRLTLTVLNETAERVTVRARLVDNRTGEPIATRGRGGYLRLNGERVETGPNGTVTRTYPRPAGGLSARFEPGQWWRHEVGYVGSSDAVYVRGTVLDGLRLLYQLGVPIGLFLIGVFIIDRFTGWGVWPLWGRSR